MFCCIRHKFYNRLLQFNKNLYKCNILIYNKGCCPIGSRQFCVIKKNLYFKKIKMKNINISDHYQNQLRRICTSTSLNSSDIPDYLQEIANEFSDEPENIIEDLEELEYMEDDISDYFVSRAIPFEELENSFSVLCPSCGDSDKSHHMFIDKNSGYCACPWCCLDGKWEDIMKIFDSQVYSLMEEELIDFLHKLKPLEESHSTLFVESFLKETDIDQLKKVDAKITEDCTKIIFPLSGLDKEITGFANFTLLHKNSKAVLRVVEGKSAFFLPLSIPKTNNLKKIVIVSNVCDALKLAKLKIHAVVLCSDPKVEVLDYLCKKFKSVILWCDPLDIHKYLLSYLSSRRIKTFVVKNTSDLKSIPSLPVNVISQLLLNALPVSFNCLMDSDEIIDRVYNRILNKDRIHGVKWTRFTELNELLLGHRSGELSIFSGQTGCGKTTFMSEYSLDLSMQGVRTLWGSFEISVPRLCEMMLQQYSGKPLPHSYPKFREIADQFSLLPIYFLNVHGQQPIKDVINMMTEAVLVKGVNHVIVDNLQFMLGLHGANADWWLEQDRVVSSFRQFATAFNCHVTLIVHPRKLNAGEKLNLNSISGGARVTQEADNVMILHVKENRDGSSNFVAPKTLQIVKNRYGGTLGEIRLRFHKESLTMSSCFRSQNSNSQFLEQESSDNEELNKKPNILDIKSISKSFFVDR